MRTNCRLKSLRKIFVKFFVKKKLKFLKTFVWKKFAKSE